MSVFAPPQRQSQSSHLVSPAAGQHAARLFPEADNLPDMEPSLGNQAMQQLLLARVIQAKLMVSQPGVEGEMETDRVAEDVSEMPRSQCGFFSSFINTIPFIGSHKLGEQHESESELVPSTRQEENDAGFNWATSGTPTCLPFREEMELAFGLNLSDVRAHVGDQPAAYGLGWLGAIGAARGDEVAFRMPTPSHELVAHEVAHVVQYRWGRSQGDAEAEADSTAIDVASGERAEVQVAVSAGPRFQKGEPLPATPRQLPGTHPREFPADIIKTLKQIDPKSVPVAQIVAAVANLTLFAGQCQQEAMFEGGPSEHAWWNLWGVFATKKQHKAESLIEMAGKAMELARSLSELTSGILGIVSQVQGYAAVLPIVEHVGEMSGELAEKVEKAGEVLGWVNAFVQACNSIAVSMEGSNKLAAFRHHPDLRSAEVWADGVGNTFDALGDTVGACPFVPVADYWKRLLKAPKPIIRSFISTLHNRYARFEEEVREGGTGEVLPLGTSEDKPVK